MFVNQLAVAALLVALAGCSDQSPPAPAPEAAAHGAAASGAAPGGAAPGGAAPGGAVPGAAAGQPAAPTLAAGTADPVDTTGSPHGSVERPPGTAPKTAPERPARRLDQFVAAVQRQLPHVVVDRRDEEVAAIGEQACTALAAGRSTTAALKVVENAGVTRADARTLLTLARNTACRS